MKKLLSAILSIVMIVSLFPVSAFAATEVASGYCGGEGDGTNLSWTLGSDGLLTISGTGAMKGYDVGGAPWYSERSRIKSVIIGNRVTSIGAGAFGGCSSLTSATLPDSVTSIGDYAFDSCLSLTSITIPNSVISIGYNAFFGCSSLTSATIPDRLTSIGNGAFAYCEGLTSVTIPGSVTSIVPAEFSGCKSLTSVTIPDGVTSFGFFAFFRCESLTSVTIPDGVTSIDDYAFRDCTSLASAVFKGNAPTTFGYDVFDSCAANFKIHAPANNTTWTSTAAYNATAQTWNGYPIVFDGGTQVTTVASGTCGGEGDGKNLSWTLDSDGLLTISGTGKMKNVYYRGQWYYERESIKSIVISDGVTSIGNGAFCDCSSVTSITIPNSVTIIGNGAFCDCSSVTSITIPNSVTIIGSTVFSGCSALTSITLPNSVTIIGDFAFSNCSSLTNITIPNSVTIIDDHAFYNCSSLTSIMIPNSVTSIGHWAFNGCKSLTSITIPSSVTSIGDYAFTNCSSLTSIKVDARNTAYCSDSYGVLFNKTKTELIQYPCGNTRTAYMIPNSVTSVGYYAFEVCGSLTSVMIPNGVTSIGVGAFSDCYSLTDVYYTGTEAQWNTLKKNIGSRNEPLLNATIHYNWRGDPADECKTYSDLSIAWQSEASKNLDKRYTGLEFRDEWLFGDSTAYNHDLARMSVGMAMAGYEAVTEYEQKSPDANIRQLYLDMGFDADSFYSDGYGAQDDNSVAFAIATKQVNGETLMALTLRGGGYGDGGWAGNFEVGGNNTALHRGFGIGMTYALNGLRSYLAAHPKIKTEHLHIWLTGYSRSAAVANILAAAIMNNGLCKKSNLYAYTFATPSTTTDSTQNYSNIFNIINPMDIVPEVPPIRWGFGKFGKTYQLPTVSVSGVLSKERFEEKFSELTMHSYRADANQELSVDYLIGVICTVIPSAQKYHDKYESALVSLKRDGSAENKEAILNELLFGNILTIADLKKCIIKDLILDHQKLRQTLNKAIIIASVKNHEVYELLVELETIALQAQYEAKTGSEPVCINLLNMIFDLLDRAVDDQTFYSELLLQHWPEVYLAWMLTADGERITQTNEFRVARIACPVNVEVYDGDGNLVGRTKTDSFTVEDEEGNEETYTVSVIDEEVTTLEAAVFGETKTFVLPEGENYSIRIVTNENYSEGDTMTVSISDYSNGSQVAGVVYEDVALSEAAQFNAVLGGAVELTDQAQTVIEPTQVIDLLVHTTPVYDVEVLREGDEYRIAGTAAACEEEQLLVCAAYSERGQYLASASVSLEQSETESDFSLTLPTETLAAEIKAFLLDPQSYATLADVTSLLNLQW